MNTEIPESGDAILEQAGTWVRRRHSGQWSRDDQQALDAWLAQDEAHRQAHARALRVWQALDRFKAAAFPARSALRMRLEMRQRKARRWRWWLGAATAALVALPVITLTPRLWWFAETHRTALGERRTVDLADGSRVELNTATEIRIQLSDQGRRVLLVGGEAYFTVAHDAVRPFEVFAAGGLVRDVGTRFDVRDDGGTVKVTVEDGEVDVFARPPQTNDGWQRATGSSLRGLLQAFDVGWVAYREPVRLMAGERMAYSEQGAVEERETVRSADPTSWREGRLVFELAPLADVAREIARYHPVSFRFADPALEQMKVSGSFETSDLRQIFKTLESAFPIRLERLSSQIVRVSRKRS